MFRENTFTFRVRLVFQLPTILLDIFRDFDFRDEQLIYEVVCRLKLRETEMDSRCKTAPASRNFAG